MKIMTLLNYFFDKLIYSIDNQYFNSKKIER